MSITTFLSDDPAITCPHPTALAPRCVKAGPDSNILWPRSGPQQIHLANKIESPEYHHSMQHVGQMKVSGIVVLPQINDWAAFLSSTCICLHQALAQIPVNCNRPSQCPHDCWGTSWPSTLSCSQRWTEPLQPWLNPNTKVAAANSSLKLNQT